MYTPVQMIAEGIAEMIRATGAFKYVTYAQASNGAQVWRMLEAMVNLPAAIVAIGTVDYEHDALKRTIRPMVVVVGEFNRYLNGDAAGIWELTERVVGAFLPALTPEGLNQPEVCGIEFVPESAVPIQSEENVSAYLVTLEGTEFLSKEVLIQ